MYYTTSMDEYCPYSCNDDDGSHHPNHQLWFSHFYPLYDQHLDHDYPTKHDDHRLHNVLHLINYCIFVDIHHVDYRDLIYRFVARIP